MDFENGVKNIQAAAYNGVRTVVEISIALLYKSLAESHKIFKWSQLKKKKRW